MANTEKSGALKYKDGSGNVTTMYPKTKIANVEGLEDWDSAMLLKNVTAALPINSSWVSVCYGDGKFVAIASYNTIAAYSTDGINWTEATLPTDAGWVSVCYGDGKFVAVTSNNTIAAYSTDGINWTQATLPTDAGWASVCYGDGKFLAVTSYNTIAAYSTDGINWTDVADIVNNPTGTDITDNLKAALGIDAIKAYTDSAIKTAIQNTWEASY